MNEVIRFKFNFNFGAASVVVSSPVYQSKGMMGCVWYNKNNRPYSRYTHPCTHSRIDGIKVILRGISGGKQVITFANTSNRGRVCFFLSSETTISKLSKVLARFTSLLFAMRTFTVATAYCKVTMITSTHILTLSSLR